MNFFCKQTLHVYIGFLIGSYSRDVTRLRAHSCLQTIASRLTCSFTSLIAIFFNSLVRLSSQFQLIVMSRKVSLPNFNDITDFGMNRACTRMLMSFSIFGNKGHWVIIGSRESAVAWEIIIASFVLRLSFSIFLCNCIYS